MSKLLNSYIKYSYNDEDENLSLSLLSEAEQVVNAGTPEYIKAS